MDRILQATSDESRQTDGRYACNSCPPGQNRKTIYRTVQARSADEGNSVIWECLVCQACGFLR